MCLPHLSDAGAGGRRIGLKRACLLFLGKWSGDDFTPDHFPPSFVCCSKLLLPTSRSFPFHPPPPSSPPAAAAIAAAARHPQKPARAIKIKSERFIADGGLSALLLLLLYYSPPIQRVVVVVLNVIAALSGPGQKQRQDYYILRTTYYSLPASS